MSTISINTDKGVIECEATWTRGGLAIHRESDPTSGWTITHLASGYSVLEFIRDEDIARNTAEALLLAGDWTKDTPAARADEDLRHTALALRAELSAQDAFILARRGNDDDDEEFTN